MGGVLNPPGNSGIMKPMDTSVPPLVHALLEPQRYPGTVHRVDLVQTAISWVLLAGDMAYKIKKPVKLPFLDFSTLALRQQYCMEELRLNRRFAPDIYLDVVGIFNAPDGPGWSGNGPPIEYAVKMRRFDEAGRLDHLCARGDLLPSHLSDLADTLCALHEKAAIAPPTTRFGDADRFMALARDNFRDLLQSHTLADHQARLNALQSWTEAQFAQVAALMSARRQAGHVRECHGDLHLANMVLINQRVRLFDCIEFNDDLRWLDVANEMAFTYMDLLEHQQPGLANWFVDALLSRSGDYEAVQLLRFYAVYKAMVRAKVAADEAQTLAYLALAERLTTPAPRRLVITHGLSGCGKTHASSVMLQNDASACTVRVRSDVERKRLFGLAPTDHHATMPGAGMYSAQATAQTYERLRALADMLLATGGTVMVDAAFLKRSERDAFHALAQHYHAAFEILAPQATPEQLTQRIESRNAEGSDPSDATIEVLAQQMRTLEPLGDNERPFVRT